MTFYEQLERQLKTKGHVVVKDKEGEYCVFSHFKDEDGLYRNSGWCTTIKRVKELIGNTSGYSEKDINKIAKVNNWNIVEVFEMPLERFEAGDKVLVGENAKEECEKYGILWCSGMDKMVGKVCAIEKDSIYWYVVYLPDKSDYFSLPPPLLTYPFKEVEEEMVGEEVEVKFKGKTYKAKIMEEVE